MVSKKADISNFYLDSVKGRPSAEVFNSIACIFALLENRSNAYFAEYQLTPIKFNTLILIKHLGREEGLNQNEISRHLIVTASNITRLIDRLIKDGYVERHAHAHDRRVKIVKVTQKGSEILEKTWHGYGEMIQQAVYLMPRPEVETLSALLLKWFSLLEQKGTTTHG
jgi:DNA-binding MarR family transcriptional regulator